MAIEAKEGESVGRLVQLLCLITDILLTRPAFDQVYFRPHSPLAACTESAMRFPTPTFRIRRAT